MIPTPYVPERGDLVWIDFDPQAGHEQSGYRPGLILSHAAYNGLVGLALVCPITKHAKGYSYEVVLPSGLPVYGIVLSDQARNMDWRARRASFRGKAPTAVVSDVIAKLKSLLV